MKIAYANHHKGKEVYFDTFSDEGRVLARSWHEESGQFYNDKPRLYKEKWYDAKGVRIVDIDTYNREMDYHFGYIYDLLLTLHQCKIETAARRKAKEVAEV